MSKLFLSLRRSYRSLPRASGGRSLPEVGLLMLASNRIAKHYAVQCCMIDFGMGPLSKPDGEALPISFAPLVHAASSQ
jgi:hypothetical protein